MHITGQIERFSNIGNVEKLWNKKNSEILRATGECFLDVRIELIKEIRWEWLNLVKGHYQARDTSIQHNKHPHGFLIHRDLIWTFAKIFWRQNFFFDMLGEINLYGGVKIIWGE